MNYQNKKEMKKTLILIITCFVSALSICAQNSKEDWREKFMNEKIAFLTTEIGITPTEGQAFWPVYNQVQKDKDEAMHNVFKSYRAMAKAIEEGKSNKEVEKLLNAYLDAQQAQREIDEKASDKYRKVLPVEKVAKLYIAEERFRRKQIHRLNHGSHQKNPQR